MMHFTVLRIVLLSLLVVLAIIGVVGICVMPHVIDNIAHGQAAFVDLSETAENYRKLPVLLYQNIYIFNITNYDSFMQGNLPTVEEKGPYTFSTEWVKNMSWTDNLLTFTENRVFHFEPEMSKGSLDDEVYHIDPILLVALDKISNLPLWLQDIIKVIVLNRPVLAKHKVRQMLYEGYPDEIAKYASYFDHSLPITPDGDVGFLVGQNNTDGGYSFTVYAGIGDDIARLNNIIEVNGSSTIPYYGKECNRIWGTNGEVFPPFWDPPATVTVFQPLLARPWDLFYNKTYSFNGISMSQYGTGSRMYSNSPDPVVNKCYQPRSVNTTGVFDASPSQHGLPILISLPHFYKADPSTRANVNGLSPNPDKHDFFLTVFPQLGVVTDMGVRMQLNFKTSASPRFPDSRHPEIIFPVFWQEIVMLEKDRITLTDLLYDKIEKPKLIIRAVCIGLVVLATLIFAISVFALTIMDSKSDKEKVERTNLLHGGVHSSINLSGRDEIDPRL